MAVINSNIIGANGKQSLQTSRYYHVQYANGIYGFLDNQGNLYTGNNQFVGQVATALGDLRQGRAVGQALFDNLMTHANSTKIVQKVSNAAEMNKGAYVTWRLIGQREHQTRQVQRYAHRISVLDTNLPTFKMFGRALSI